MTKTYEEKLEEAIKDRHIYYTGAAIMYVEREELVEALHSHFEGPFMQIDSDSSFSMKQTKCGYVLLISTCDGNTSVHAVK